MGSSDSNLVSVDLGCHAFNRYIQQIHSTDSFNRESDCMINFNALHKSSYIAVIQGTSVGVV